MNRWSFTIILIFLTALLSGTLPVSGNTNILTGEGEAFNKIGNGISILGSPEDGWELTISADGSISQFKIFKGKIIEEIPFRKDQYSGPSWYVRKYDDGEPVNIKFFPDIAKKLSYTGHYGNILFKIHFKKQDGLPAVEVSASNEGESPFMPMTAGIRIGFDSEQIQFPTWNDKLVPNVMRCEPTHHWGFGMSPDRTILGWVCPYPTASWSINYNSPGKHRIYTANIDFINQTPLPERHPQHLTSLAPGQTRKWTVLLIPVKNLESVKPLLSEKGQIPIFDAKNYTIPQGDKTLVTIYGPKVTRIYLKHPRKGQIIYKEGKIKDEVNAFDPDLYNGQITAEDELVRRNGRMDFIFDEKDPGLYTFHVVCKNGKICEGTIFVRRPWKWYLENARLEGLRTQPTETHHGPCIYPFYSYFLARKHVPDDKLDYECEKVFQKYWPLHYNEVKKELRYPLRIQDNAIWAGALADRYEVTGNEQDLIHAANLVDYVITTQGEDGGYYDQRWGKPTLYTSVNYMAKHIMDVMRYEKELSESSPEWQERYQRHRKSVERAIDNLEQLGDNIETEGEMTYEDGMISCTMMQLAFYAIKNSRTSNITKYLEAAEYLRKGHDCLTLNLHPDARVNGSTIRFWETIYTVCLMHNMYNSPCGWSAWKLYGLYYMYLLTGNEEYLRQAFNGLGSTIQLLNWESGHLFWGFTPDPFIFTKWVIPTKNPDDKKEHEWVYGIRGEEYIEPISDWNRTKPVWRSKWGIDNFTHEVFKLMEEMALTNAYVIEREDGTVMGYNCNVMKKGDNLKIVTTEELANRIHLNLKNQYKINADISGHLVENIFGEGCQWIGPGGVPENLRPL